MAWFVGMRRRVAAVAGVLGAALLLGAGTPTVGLLGQAAHAAPARQSVYAFLTGTWLGRGLGDTGGCGTEVGQFTFFSNAEYSYSVRSMDCASFTVAGYYRVQNGVITTRWVECSFACQPGSASSRLAVISSNAIAIVDAGGTYLYHRQ